MTPPTVPVEIPESIDAITPALLTSVIAEFAPGTLVDDLTVIEVAHYGDTMVSTSDRAVLELSYSGDAPDLPRRVVMKMKRGQDHALAALYDTEVNFYRALRPGLPIEAPQAIGALYQSESARFCLLLEDLSVRFARFPNVTTPVTIEEIKAVLDTLAQLHAHFWESPRFGGDLASFQSHVGGLLHDHFNRRHPIIAERELEIDPYKAQLVSRLDTTPAKLWAKTLAVQRHQAGLPQTIVHGDAHIGNTYLLPDGTAGLVDWQLTVRGAWVHDVNYAIVTGLPVAEARDHEQDLLRYYLEKLASLGVENPPIFDDAWEDYRRAIVWGLEVGWLGTPAVNYGAEINETNHERMAAAYTDLETSKLIAALA